MDYLDENRVNVIYQMPLSKLCSTFDKLKSSTKGYVTDYEISNTVKVLLLRWISCNGERVILVFIVHKNLPMNALKLS